MDQAHWQFWIDVGGTFTDCFGRRPDGSLVRAKMLSSGATKGAAAAGSTAERIVDPLRIGAPDDFWRGYTLRLLDAQGQSVGESRAAASHGQSGELQLDTALPTSPSAGQSYELFSGEGAPILAIRKLLALRLDQAIGPVAVRLGTTRGTNALLTRRGARAALVTTKGFGDILEIGYQNRPRLFDLTIRKRLPLYEAVVEIDERIAADGEVLRRPDEKAIRRQVSEIRARGIQSLAICLLNAYQHAAHEELLERIAREVGFEEISTSSRVAPLMKIVARGDTTVMDAYLNPVLRDYVRSLRGTLAGSDLRMLTSAGGLVDADRFVGKDSILSGPAGGVVGFSTVARNAGYERAIGFDMGGTSTDVARFDGRYELEYETEKAGVRIVAPMMSIETVAAGGGSVCQFDGVKLAVGPDSAGADPGPACYGRGGPLAVTDVNFFLGRILPERFPFPLDRRAVERRLAALCDEIDSATGTRYQPVELADGFLRVANANMVKAIRSISIAKGYDPRDYTLVAFGGAAAQHACEVADELGITRILNHPDAGILSAYGIGMADVVRHAATGIYRPYGDELRGRLAEIFEPLVNETREAVIAEGVEPEQIEVVRSLDLRYRGLDAYLTITQPGDGDWQAAYEAEHQRLYGYVHSGRPLEVVAARVEANGRSSVASEPSTCVEKKSAPRPESTTTAWFAAQEQTTNVYARVELRPGDVIPGPAIVHEPNSTTVIDPGWSAELLTAGELLLTRTAASRAPQSSTPDPATADPVLLEIFNNQFAGIAEQMGITLRNTACSVNVKERLDFSCAIFTAAGGLVVNAPHIPVHLGAMGETVKWILRDNPTIRPGDVFVTNDPYRGGSHLPDVTVITPVHEPTSGELLFLTASRAHHAEIGGIRPGSMPPGSKNLAEEGVRIRNFKLVDAGRSRLDELETLLRTAPYPSRAVADNLADISAQVAANNQGVRDLQRLVERATLPVTLAYMRHIQDAAERKMRLALAKFPDGRHEFVDHLDDGSSIAVAITIDGDRATIDFAGTGPVLPGNLNANRAIVTAAAMYCLRLLIDEDIPLNEGVLAPVEILLPECLLCPPDREDPALCAAVVGGNVETSQRVVDVLLGALGVAAASQGTMNNVLFGDATFGYYETICGGSGATAAGDGADAVHTHMTNTRLTDPEVIEKRWPVRVEEFSVRRDSGGAGKHRGGDGVVRRLVFLRDLDVSILTQRRGEYAPYGRHGGASGATGRNTLLRADGSREQLPGAAEVATGPGDTLIIETPGGGGWGER